MEDVHKDSIDTAVGDAPREADIRHLGTVPGGAVAVTKAMRNSSARGTRRCTSSTRPEPAASGCSATLPRRVGSAM